MSTALGTVEEDLLSPHESLDGFCRPDRFWSVEHSITIALVAAPLVAVAVVLPLLWGRAATLGDVVIAVVAYVVTGLGVTVGFHRLFTHGSFTATRGVKIALAIAGSMALEGSLIAWVANHRRHHRFSDTVGDPHSPHRYGPGAFALVRGLAYAHVGWLFSAEPTSAERYAPDLLRDPDLVAVSRWFPVLGVASLLVPFGLGYAITGTLSGAFIALIWGGLVRMALLHHVTWSVNSLCHAFGKRPFTTRDESRNLRVLALVSFGESWHNTHHAHPAWARHGALKGQIDLSARFIRTLELLGWATRVRWPSRDALVPKRAVTGEAASGRALVISAQGQSSAGRPIVP